MWKQKLMEIRKQVLSEDDPMVSQHQQIPTKLIYVVGKLEYSLERFRSGVNEGIFFSLIYI